MANDISPDPNYLLSVYEYLQWHVNHLEEDGTLCDYTGTYPNYTSTGDCDSTDAYAAQFIETAYMYYDVTEDSNFLDWVWPYVIQVAGAMDLTLQSDGLTWAKPSYHVKYLMDNSDVYIAYKVAGVIAALKSDSARQAEWSTKAANCLAGIETMYLGDLAGRYASAKFENDDLYTSWTNVYPDGDAQMSAIRNVLMETNTPRALNVWNTTIQQFIPNYVPVGDLSSAWVLSGIGVGQGNEAETVICFISMQKGNAYWDGYIMPDYQNIMVMHDRIMHQQNGDLNMDGRINFEDFVVYVSGWDGNNLEGLANLSSHWLRINTWWDRN
jgi:hypothetical protein